MNTIEQIVQALQEHLNTAEVRGIAGRQFRLPLPAIECRDGVKFSVQAGEMVYSTPRSNQGPWTHVEVMTVSVRAKAKNWEEDDSGIGAYVPIEAVAQEILDRGYLQIEN